MTEHKRLLWWSSGPVSVPLKDGGVLTRAAPGSPGTNGGNMTHELTSLLRRSVEGAQFEAVDTTPGIRPPQTRTAAELRSIYEYNRVTGRSPIAITRVHLDDALRTELTDALRVFLSDYILGDEIGVGLFGWYPVATSMERFTDHVLQAGAILGPEAVTALLERWAHGEPVGHREHAVLSGARVDQPVEVAEGLYLENLPNNSEQVRHHLPPYTTYELGEFSLLSKLKASIDCLSGPAFVHPSQIDEAGYQRWRYGDGIAPIAPRELLNALCEVLSLSCNTYITWLVSWSDYWHEAGAFGSGAGRSSSSYNSKALGTSQIQLSP